MSALAETAGLAPALQWTDDWLLGHDGMDACHQECATLLGQLLAAEDAQLVTVFDRFIAHLTEHFEAEAEMMRRTDFPPRQCHLDEHAAVMSSVLEVRHRLADGNLPLVRALARELGAWFPAHTQHLDSALAHWVSRHRLGGKPVVLKRRAVLG